MPILFLTDYGLKDEYVGVVKCVIHSINPKSQIIDICHEISSHSIITGIYIVEKILDYCPDSSIILGIVDPGVGSKRESIIGNSKIKGKKIFFVGPNNGLFSPLLTGKHKVYEIDEQKIINLVKKYGLNLYISNTFHGRDIFGPAAALLSLGLSIEKLAKKELKNPEKLEIPEPKIKGDTIEGLIIHIDKFGNIITNIKEGTLKGAEKILVKISDGEFREIRILKSYAEAEEDELFGIIGSYRTLEISKREKSAQEQLRTKILDKIILRTKTEKLSSDS